MATIVIDGLKSDGDLWNSITWSNINQIVHRLQVRIVKAEIIKRSQRLLSGA